MLDAWKKPSTAAACAGWKIQPPKQEKHSMFDAWRKPSAATTSAGGQIQPSKQEQRGRRTGMHGVSVSDHADKAHWSGYWEAREGKLKAQRVNGALFSSISSSLSGAALPGPTAPITAGEYVDAPLLSRIFEQCCIYFDGRVDSDDGLSSYSLGKLARLHGAYVGLRPTKRGTTHVVCTQLSGAKERRALEGDLSGRGTALYFVLPAWITQSISAGRRLGENRFSLLARIAQETGLKRLGMLQDSTEGTKRAKKENVAPLPTETASILIAASPPEPTRMLKAADVVEHDELPNNLHQPWSISTGPWHTTCTNETPDAAFPMASPGCVASPAVADLPERKPCVVSACNVQTSKTPVVTVSDSQSQSEAAPPTEIDSEEEEERSVPREDECSAHVDPAPT